MTERKTYGLHNQSGLSSKFQNHLQKTTVHLNKSETPLTTLAALRLFLKVYDPGFASKTNKALPRAVWSKGIFKFPSHS